MYNLTIKFKLRAAAVLTLILIGILTLFALGALGSMHRAGTDLAADTRQASNLSDLRASIQALTGSNLGVIAAHSSDLSAILVDWQQQNIKNSEKALRAVKADHVNEPKAQALIAKVEDNFEKLVEISERSDFQNADTASERDASIEAMGEYAQALDVAVSKLTELDAKHSAASIDEVENTFKSARTWQIILAVIVVMISSAVFLHLYRAIIPRLLAFVSLANKWAEGDLTQTAAVKGKDCLAQLAEGLNAMIVSWRSIAEDLKETSTQVGASAEKILSTAGEQHQSAQSQAAAVTQTTAAADEVRASAEVAATQAAGVAEQAQRSGEVGEQGSRAMQDVMASMSSIRDQVESISSAITALAQQTQQIEDITATVSDLADQSNLLALNATIEAARAGEQGKGFAVVADEVRNLAEQSKQAVSQVQAILGEIQNATGAAVRNAEQGSDAVADAVGQVEKAGGVIDELITANLAAAQAAQQISASVQQQNIGMEEITRAMEDTKQASDAFVEGVNQSRQYAEDLSEIAARLGEVSGKLKVDSQS